MSVLLLLLVVLLVAAAAPASQAAPHSRPCRAALPSGPAVPAPVVLRTSCGAFRLARDGRVNRLPAGWLLARQTGTERRYGGDLNIRRNAAGRITLLRKGNVVWRSSGLYPRDGGDIAFGPNAFAFASYRRGIFLTDMRSPERLLVRGRGLFPRAFVRDGSLLVGRGSSLSVVAQDGSVVRRYRYRGLNGYVFDERTETLIFVTRNRVLVRADATGVHPIRRLGGLEGWIYPQGENFLVFHSNRAVTVIRRDGRFVAGARWPNLRGWTTDSGLIASADGRTFAFRLSKTNASRTRGKAILYLLPAGESRARAVYRQRLDRVGCWTGASLGWHGRFLLYSSADGNLLVLDSRDGSTTSLTGLGRALPRQGPADRAGAYWLSSLPPPR